MFTFNLFNFDIKSLFGFTKYEVPKEENTPSKIQAYKYLYVMCYNYIAAFANMIDKIINSKENTKINFEEDFNIIKYEKDCIWCLLGYEHKLFNKANIENCKNEFIQYYEKFKNVYDSGQTREAFTDDESVLILKSLKITCDALWKLSNIIKDK